MLIMWEGCKIVASCSYGKGRENTSGTEMLGVESL